MKDSHRTIMLKSYFFGLWFAFSMFVGAAITGYPTFLVFGLWSVFAIMAIELLYILWTGKWT